MSCQRGDHLRVWENLSHWCKDLLEMCDLGAVDVLSLSGSPWEKWAPDQSKEEDVNEGPGWVRQAWFASYSACPSFHASSKNKDKYLGNVAIQIKQKCFVMYVEVTEGASRAHTKCPSGESFKGAARSRGRLGKETATAAAAQPSHTACFPAYVTQWKWGPGPPHRGQQGWPACIRDLSGMASILNPALLPASSKITAWPFVYHLTKGGLTGESCSQPTWHVLSFHPGPACEGPERHQRSHSLIRHILSLNPLFIHCGSFKYCKASSCRGSPSHSAVLRDCEWSLGRGGAGSKCFDCMWLLPLEVSTVDGSGRDMVVFFFSYSLFLFNRFFFLLWIDMYRNKGVSTYRLRVLKVLKNE